MLLLIGLALILYLTYRLYQYFFPSPNIDPHGKYVLISGCDTGFGHLLAIELDKQGFNVFAGIYNPNNQLSLKAKLSPRATVFCLDITRPTDIDAAYNIVKEKTNTLHALVNNAGLGQGGLIDWTTVEFMRSIMDVNFFGHVAMTKKFLPLLIVKRDSRVVNICSAAGYIASPAMSAYCASKYALEAFSDCLRREMFVWDLRVSIFEPGFMRTPIIEGHDHSLRNLWNKLSADIKDRWGTDYLDKQAQLVAANPLIRYAENPNKVVRELTHAVMNTAPRIRYRPGWQSSVLLFPLSMGPAWLLDFIIAAGNKSPVLPAGVSKQVKD